MISTLNNKNFSVMSSQSNNNLIGGSFNALLPYVQKVNTVAKKRRHKVGPPPAELSVLSRDDNDTVVSVCPMYVESIVAPEVASEVEREVAPEVEREVAQEVAPILNQNVPQGVLLPSGLLPSGIIVTVVSSVVETNGVTANETQSCHDSSCEIGQQSCLKQESCLPTNCVVVPNIQSESSSTVSSVVEVVPPEPVSRARVPEVVQKRRGMDVKPRFARGKH